MSRQEILNVIDKWVSEGSGWVIDRIDSHYIKKKFIDRNHHLYRLMLKKKINVYKK